MKMIAVVFLGLFLNAHAYEWNQVTETGVINKTIVKKNKKADKDLNFSDLDIKEKKLSNEEVHKKFPTLSNPKTIVFMGDTGCRVKEGKIKSEFQDCNDSNVWPFQKIVDEAGKENPDLVIHLGDFHYREKCSAGQPCEKYSPVVGYDWRPWELDFFQPMQGLLLKTPIIIVRGNHEECKRAYLGYKMLLANASWDKECVDYEAPQIITIGDIAFIDIDSSSITDMPFDNDEKIWIKRFNDVYEKVSKLNVKHIWMITHKPLYGIVPFKVAIFPINIHLRNYFEKSQLKDKVSVIFSGHIHSSMVVTPKKYAKQIILGNSGTDLTKFPTISKSSLESFSYESAHLTTTGFGYAVLKKADDQSWTIIFKDSNGKEDYRERLP